MNVYTMEQWQADGDFKAQPGQEIAAAVYNEMRETVPPLPIPGRKAEQALEAYSIPVHDGFLMGEPTKESPDGLLYRAFGMNDYGKGKHYFYLGLSLPAEMRTGTFYFMECMNAFINDGLFPAAEFKDDADAIQTAADYEATLYRQEWKDGERISSVLLYEPRYM